MRRTGWKPKAWIVMTVRTKPHGDGGPAAVVETAKIVAVGVADVFGP